MNNEHCGCHTGCTEELKITIIGNKDNNWRCPVRAGDTVQLRKDPNNAYDDEAIRVLDINGNDIGWVANSTRTVAQGTFSAGRVYDKLDDLSRAKIVFKVHDGPALARILGR